jgi:hypothetical protein
MRAQRNWTANETILDGGSAGSVVTIASYAGNDTQIDGFTITHGRSGGGGLFADLCHAHITNNYFYENEVLHPVDGKGGAIYCERSFPTIADNRISHNHAKFGSGIYWLRFPVSSVRNHRLGLRKADCPRLSATTLE